MGSGASGASDAGRRDDFGVERPELIGDVRVERDGGDCVALQLS
jgi:hypothetical protein